MSGIYWGLTAMDLMNSLSEMDKEVGVQFVLSCQHECGGFGGNVDHDPHMLYTLSALQILALFDSLDRIDKDKVAEYFASLQQPDGSFMGDKWGEIDTRFSYIAINGLSLLGKLEAIDLKKAVEFILKCKNFDGSFGVVPGAESHAGQSRFLSHFVVLHPTNHTSFSAFCCVGALAIAGALEHVDTDLLGWWLAERQLESGGLNGRPEKAPDVCYSWWVLSSLKILHRIHWIDGEKLKKWILQCQDDETGGIADRPGDLVDVFHTYFGIAGLSFLGYPGLVEIDPAYALPVPTLQRLGIPTPWRQAPTTTTTLTTSS